MAQSKPCLRKRTLDQGIQSEDGQTRIDVQLIDETVWLTQKLMAELFQLKIPTINEHIRNIYSEGELVPEATIRKFRIVQKEGKRDVERLIDFYNDTEIGRGAWSNDTRN